MVTNRLFSKNSSSNACSYVTRVLRYDRLKNNINLNMKISLKPHV